MTENNNISALMKKFKNFLCKISIHNYQTTGTPFFSRYGRRIIWSIKCKRCDNESARGINY